MNFITNYGSNASRMAVIILPVHKWKTEGKERSTGLISTGQEKHINPCWNVDKHQEDQ